ncbi:unnamed protein product [Cuscuta europaea]|uniref:Uncharacterized protein n=1 Tax=Cuscuta europaea TaxID=41803 RepID=A0A9P1EDJ4_CUSEU|nr:unnamed protein product [Cuscuta europaea]
MKQKRLTTATRHDHHQEEPPSKVRATAYHWGNSYDTQSHMEAFLLKGTAAEGGGVCDELEEGGLLLREPPLAEEGAGRERLQRHRHEVAGRVWIPEMWGQEEFLKDWIDSCTFDASWVNANIILARTALVETARRTPPPPHPTPARLRIDSTCFPVP